MTKPAFPHDLPLKKLKARRRFLKRSIRKARIRKAHLVARRASRKRIGQVNGFITKRKKQLRHVNWEILRRRRTLRERLHIPKKGWVLFDGHYVAGWIAEDLHRARASGIWRGVVISGRRDRNLCIRLCLAMCGRVRCPGRCAGASSNHVLGPKYPYGAVDVTDSYGLMKAERELGLRLKHTLPNDLPHHSATGQ